MYYLAPMEGITGFVYRNAYAEYYGGIDKYFTPFLSPHTRRVMTAREIRDLTPEHNRNLEVVPQILTNQPEAFVNTAKKLKELGYCEINLNLGCPSGTVVSKGRGAGFLADPDKLDRFFDEIYESFAESGEEFAVSVKTRLGVEDPREFERILEVYNRYPISELVIHARARADFYNGKPDLATFEKALENSCIPVIYNGDICAKEDLWQLEEHFSQNPAYKNLKGFMIGRGLLKRPWFLTETMSDAAGTGQQPQGIIIDKNQQQREQKQKFLDFHEQIVAGYSSYLSGDRDILFKMKELWLYMSEGFTGSDRYIKKIKKSDRMPELLLAAQELVKNCDMIL